MTVSAAGSAVPAARGRGWAIAWLFVKMFFATGLLFGVMSGLFGWLLLGRESGILFGARAGLFYGTSMAVGLVLLTVWRNPKGGSSSFRVKQDRLIEVDGDREEVIHRVASAMSRLPGARETLIEPGADVVRTTVGWTWWSFGENVVARIESIDAERHRVRVESRPRVRTTIADYGKNGSNVDAVVAALTAPARD